MAIEILCTLGPASFDARVIERLEALGVTLFRINLSHTSLGDLRGAVGRIQSVSSVPVCLDTEVHGINYVFFFTRIQFFESVNLPHMI